MVVAAVACVVGLVVVAWSLYRDDSLPEPAGRRTPDWGPLPEPADLVRLELPRAVAGYDPESVDAHLDALVVAYRDLLAEAPPEVVARARRRAAARRGLVAPADERLDDVDGHDVDGHDGEADDRDGFGADDVLIGAPPGDLDTVFPEEDPREALRAEAALAALRAPRQRGA